jgi:hypothetical protein
MIYLPQRNGFPESLVFPDVEPEVLEREEILYADRRSVMAGSWLAYLERMLPRHDVGTRQPAAWWFVAAAEAVAAHPDVHDGQPLYAYSAA